MDQHDQYLEERGRSLEEEFFHRENKQLIEKLRQMKQIEQTKESLAQASGIQDEALLEKLVQLGLGADTVAALTLVPLVEVAWSDGTLDEREREAILRAAHESGFREESLGYRLLQQWLRKPPGKKLRHVWREYIQAVCRKLSLQDQERLKGELLGRARTVAEASGGYLGLLAKTSKSEAGVLEDLEQAFQEKHSPGG